MRSRASHIDLPIASTKLRAFEDRRLSSFFSSFFPADAVKVLGEAGGGGGGGGVPPAQRSSPLINLVGGGASCPSTSALAHVVSATPVSS